MEEEEEEDGAVILTGERKYPEKNLFQ